MSRNLNSVAMPKRISESGRGLPTRKKWRCNRDLTRLYIFMKLLEGKTVKLAGGNRLDGAQQKLRFCRILLGRRLRLSYDPGKRIRVHDGNSEACPPVAQREMAEARKQIWSLLQSSRGGLFPNSALVGFLRRSRMVEKGSSSGGYFLGEDFKDIFLQGEHDENQSPKLVRLSLVSDFDATETVLKASKDNTNFLFRVDGGMDDALAAGFNSLFDARGGKQVIATARRMRLLKERGCSLTFVRAVSPTAERNLRMVGGRDLSVLVAEMLRHYYFDGEGASSFSPVSRLVDWLSNKSQVGEGEPGDVKDVCRYQISHLLYAMFTGMRLGTPWSGRTSVSGGYIVARDDGEVLAYHTCIADEFKDFLIQRLALEQPSHGRHLSLYVEKGDDGCFYVKLPLQIRFRANREKSDD